MGKANDIPSIDTLPNGKKRIRKMIKGKKIDVTGDTDEEVLANYLMKKSLLNKEFVVKPKKKAEAITLEQAIDIHIANLAQGGSPSTIRGYEIIKRNAYPLLMKRDIRKITKAEWQKAADDETKVYGYAPKTVKNHYDLCCTVMRENNITPPKLSLPSAEKSEEDVEGNVVFLDDQELIKFCRAIKGSKYELMAYLAMNSLRCSELYGLTWDKINTTTQKITVYGSVVPDKDNKMVRRKDQNKNTSSKRIVPILFPRIIELAEEADKSGSITLCTPNYFYKWIKKKCDEAGVTVVGIHGLRHSGASLCIYKQVPMLQVQRWFGWKDDKMLSKIYFHMSEKQINLEAKKISEFSEQI